MRWLITGGCGFLGSNLSDAVMERGGELLILDNLSRKGSEKNLEWLRSRGKFEFQLGDIRDPDCLDKVMKNFHPHTIYHVAGQVAMTTSIANPREDFEINALGTVNLLEAARKFSPHSTIIYSSTNKVYGDLVEVEYKELPLRYRAEGYPDGFDERTPLNFHSPYGCSKGSADQYMQDYARIFGLETVVFRHSSIYGGRQYSTYDQGWIGWFCTQALKIKAGLCKDKLTISGNGKQVRDVLHEQDLRALYFLATEKIDRVAGECFNIGGGMGNSMSLLELFNFLNQELGIEISYERLPPRVSDQLVFVADVKKATRLLGWKPQVDKHTGIRRMLDWSKEGMLL